MWTSPSPVLHRQRRSQMPAVWRATGHIPGHGPPHSQQQQLGLAPCHPLGAAAPSTSPPTPAPGQPAHRWSRSRRPRCLHTRRRRAQRHRPHAPAPCGSRRWSWLPRPLLHPQPRPPAGTAWQRQGLEPQRREWLLLPWLLDGVACWQRSRLHRSGPRSRQRSVSPSRLCHEHRLTATATPPAAAGAEAFAEQPAVHAAETTRMLGFLGSCHLSN